MPKKLPFTLVFLLGIRTKNSCPFEVGILIINLSGFCGGGWVGSDPGGGFLYLQRGFCATVSAVFCIFFDGVVWTDIFSRRSISQV